MVFFFISSFNPHCSYLKCEEKKFLKDTFNNFLANKENTTRQIRFEMEQKDPLDIFLF